MNFLKSNMKWVCHHSHLDKSNIITKTLLQESDKHMRDKWYIMDDIKRDYNRKNLSYRINKSIQTIASQNCNHISCLLYTSDAADE